MLPALQAEHVVRADIIVFAQRAQVTYRHFVDPVFIPGIDLLRGAQHPGEGLASNPGLPEARAV